ncbi:MAG: hypothetical protein DRH03_01625 [Deltaproteobacteria bacterium]|nr:MAG: hypothetical protein DRH03_01625 [Deltaproteobacteria bacterium]
MPLSTVVVGNEFSFSNFYRQFFRLDIASPPFKGVKSKAMTPIETDRVFDCYVAIGVKLDICISQQHVKFDPSYGGAKPKPAPSSRFFWRLCTQRA